MPHRRAVVARVRTACLLLLSAVACARPRAGTPPPMVAAEACKLVAPPARGSDTIVVGLSAQMDPAYAPRPRDPAERLVFGQLYETLIRVDCEGHILPGLASSWTVDSAARQWMFTLRDDAHFWSGTPVTASDVVESWRRDARGVAPPVRAIDARTVAVTVSEAPPAIPFVLADPALAVRGPASSASWPEGTGRYRIEGAVAPGAGTPAGAGAAHGTLRLATLRRVDDPIIELRDASGGDARDLLDAGADLIATDDPVVVEYAVTHPDFDTAPLPWERTYALLSPTRRGGPATRQAASPDADRDEAAALRDALARAAVRGEARAAEGPFWWEDSTACGPGAPTTDAQGTPGPTPPLSRRIVYERGDRLARDLAERLAALSAFGDGTASHAPPLSSVLPELRTTGGPVTSAPLAPEEYAAALRAGSELAYVVALPRRPVAPCAERRRLLERATWIGAVPTGAPVAASGRSRVAQPRLGSVIVPLVDVRSRVILRRGAVGVTTDWDGTLRLVGADSVTGSAVR